MALNPKRIQGFSLIEFVITVAAFGLLALTLPPIFRQLLNNISAASANMQSQERLRLADRHIQGFLSSALRSSVRISQESNEAPFSKIEFTDTKGRDISIFQRDRDLIHSKNGNEFTVLKKGLGRLIFTYPDFFNDSHIEVSISVVQDVSKERFNEMGYSSNLVYLDHR